MDLMLFVAEGDVLQERKIKREARSGNMEYIREIRQKGSQGLR